MNSIEYDEDIFELYFYFIQERMNILWSRLHGNQSPWTSDPILGQYRFTNVYRVTDRVSQYLIAEVIHKHADLPPEDIILRVVVFKIFNRIDTWEFIESKVGMLSCQNFDTQKISQLLMERRQQRPIFNNAYMMTGTHSRYNHLTSKHEKWLSMVENELISPKNLNKILGAKSLKDLYESLRSISFIGNFLAYQYAIDINYSNIFEFDENSFVKAGIGAVRGIKKCFKKINPSQIDSAIYFTLENFESLQQRFGYNDFTPVPGRKPTLIDLQNCFCETDKYLRARRPDLVVDNKRIKQKYRQGSKMSSIIFPAYWNIRNIGVTCS